MTRPTTPAADPTTAALAEDRVVRGALRTFVHVRRYQKFYAAGVVWLVVMAMLPAGSPLRAPLLGPSGESSITPVDDVATGHPGPGAPGASAGAVAPSTPAGQPGTASSPPPAGPGGAPLAGAEGTGAAPPPPFGDTGAAPGDEGGDAWRCDLDDILPAPVAGQVAGTLDTVLGTVPAATGADLPVDALAELGCTTTAATAPVAPTAALANLAAALEALAGTIDAVAGALEAVGAAPAAPAEVHGSVVGLLDQLALDLAAVGRTAGPVAGARRDGSVDDRTVVRLLGPSHAELVRATERADAAGMGAVASMAAAGLPTGVQPAFVPGVPVPDLPEELQPALEALAPLLAEGCKAVGLVGVVVFLVGGTVDDVPTDEIYPLVEPLFLLCGQVPYPETTSRCALDDSSPVDGVLGDVSGDVPAETPPALGTLLDQLLAIEAAIETLTGQTLPASIAAELSEQLDCRTQDLSDDGIVSFGDGSEWADSDGGLPPQADGGTGVLDAGLPGGLPATGGDRPALAPVALLLALGGLAARRARARLTP